MRLSVFAGLPLVLLFACSSDNTPAGPSGDAGPDRPIVDAAPDTADAAPAPQFPSFTPFMPQIQNHKGGVLTAPKIVTVTWSTDTNHAFYEAFDDNVGASDYWKATTPEYGVGPATGGGHVSVTTAAPLTESSDQLDMWIASQVGAAPGNGWPANDPNTLYLFYLPESLKLTLGGNTECNQGVGGYHEETMSPDGSQIVYGVVGLECHTVYQEGVTQFATHVASHEIVEAVTDPHVMTGNGWVGYDGPHWAWAQLEQYANEVGDACEWFHDSTYLATSPPDWVQRTWSNVSAAAAHNPCQPNTDVYFNVTPLDLQDITIRDQNQKFTTKGYPMTVGMAASVDLGFYSDAPTMPWTVDVVEGNPLVYGTPSPTVTIATTTTSGKDGDVTTVYITPNYPSPANGTLLTAVSTGNGVHYMPFLIMAK